MQLVELKNLAMYWNSGHGAMKYQNTKEMEAALQALVSAFISPTHNYIFTLAYVLACTVYISLSSYKRSKEIEAPGALQPPLARAHICLCA